MQHRGEAIEYGPDRIIFVQMEPAADAAGHHGAQFRPISDFNHVLSSDPALNDALHGSLKHIFRTAFGLRIPFVQNYPGSLDFRSDQYSRFETESGQTVIGDHRGDVISTHGYQFHFCLDITFLDAADFTEKRVTGTGLPAGFFFQKKFLRLPNIVIRK